MIRWDWDARAGQLEVIGLEVSDDSWGACYSAGHSGNDADAAARPDGAGRTEGGRPDAVVHRCHGVGHGRRPPFLISRFRPPAVVSPWLVDFGTKFSPASRGGDGGQKG